MHTIPFPLFLLLLKLSGRRNRFLSAAGLSSAVRKDRRDTTAAPPDRLAAKFSVSRNSIHGRDCFTLAPRENPGTCHILYLHGGAYVTEMSLPHWQFLASLVEATRCTFHVPIYPLAPEHTHRDAFPMVTAAYRALSADIPPRQLILMGDSAGAGFALALAQRLQGEGLPQPRDIVLISPWVDLTITYAEAGIKDTDDPWLALPGLREAACWWAGGCNRADAHLSPINGPLKGLGRLTLFIGSRDVLAAECRALRDRAAAEGVQIGWHEAPGMIHVWPLLPLRQAVTTRAMIAAIIRDGASANQ